MEHNTSLLITIVAAAAFGLLAQVLAHRWRIPAIVLLLVIGIILGKDVIGLVQPGEMGSGLSILVKLAVAIILFEGALNLNLKSLRHNAREVRNLVTVGVLVGWVVITLITHFVAGLDWRLAILFGALMTVTGPTVVQPLMKRINIPHSLKSVLEAEAILVDPIGAILAIAVMDVVFASPAQGSMGLAGVIWAYFGRLLVGGAVGALGALLLAVALKARNLVPAELTNLVALACVWATFGAAEWLHSEAGIMAVVVMGFIAQNASIPGVRQLRSFKETLTTLGISMLFILLAANLELSTLWEDGASSIVAVLLIMLVARPLAVFVSMIGSRFTWREKLFIAWIGPRGIIAASVASIFSISLVNYGVAGGEKLLALTFLTIILTVTIQGLSAGLAADLLGLKEMKRRKVLIVGANRLGNEIARLLRKHDRPALVVDTNPSAVETARLYGIEAVRCNALEEDALDELDAEEYATFLAVTSNSEVNVLACQMAKENFRIEQAYPAITNPVKGANPSLLKQTGGRLAFGRFVAVSDWDRTTAPIQEVEWVIPANRPIRSSSDIEIPCEFVPVLRVRRESAEVVHAEQTWQPGDVILMLSICEPEKVLKSLEML